MKFVAAIFLLLMSACQQQQVAYTGNAEVKYLTTQQMKAACPPNAQACSYVWSTGQCFIYIHENYKNNASWNYTYLTHEYLHCTGQIPSTQ